MLYLAVQIWFWVCLSAAIGLVVGLKLQRRNVGIATAEQPNEAAEMHRELEQARTETAAARKQVESLKARIGDLETNLAEPVDDGEAGVVVATAETEALHRRIEDLEAQLARSEGETAAAREAMTRREPEAPEADAPEPAEAAEAEEPIATSGLRQQIANLESELEAALPPVPEDEVEDKAEDEQPAAAAPLPPHGLDAPIDGKADDLKRINGIGPKMETKLFELGIYHYGQLARFADEDVARLDEALKTRGRIAREDWVGQATVLHEGQNAEEAGSEGKSQVA